MATVRFISRILFVLTRLAALGYGLSFALSALAFATGWSLHVNDQQSRFVIYYPFTTKPYLLGEYNSGYLCMFLLLLGMYTLFFYLVSRVFTVFTQTRLFTTYGIRQLQWFYRGNLLLPSLVTVLISLVYPLSSPVEVLISLHFLLGVFTYFLAVIFEQGLTLQNEQDLII